VGKCYKTFGTGSVIHTFNSMKAFLPKIEPPNTIAGFQYLIRTKALKSFDLSALY